MVSREIITGVLILAVGAAGGYLLMKDRGPAPEDTPHIKDRAVEETIEFVSYFDRIPPDEIKIVSSESAEWPDGCLGLPMDGELCTQALVPGYKITLEADGKIMILRTNIDGSSIRRDTKAEKVRDPD